MILLSTSLRPSSPTTGCCALSGVRLASKRHSKAQVDVLIQLPSICGLLDVGSAHFCDHRHIELRIILLHVLRPVLLPELLDHGFDGCGVSDGYSSELPS